MFPETRLIKYFKEWYIECWRLIARKPVVKIIRYRKTPQSWKLNRLHQYHRSN